MALVGVLRQRSWAWALPMIAGSLAAVGLNASGPSAVWRHGGIGAGRAQPEMTAVGLHVWINDTRRAVTWESDGREASVAFNRADGLAFFVNGKSDGNALGDAPTQIMLGVLGAVLHPEPKTAFVVGLGTGESAGWLAEVETIERVDVAELEPDIAHMAQRCSSLNFNVLSHPKVKITYNDAREMLLSSRARYDLIVSEPSNPYRSGVANLFTREFYAAARSRLQDGGLFVQWLQGYEIDALAARTVFATLHQEFPHVEVWQSKVSDLLLVCSVQPLTYSAAELRERLQRPSLKRAAATAWRATDVETVLGHFIAGAPLTSQIAADPPVLVNTDDLNHLEYGAARSVGAAGGFESRMLRALAEKHKHHRPSGDMADIDWERVLDAAIALYAFEGGEGPVLPNVPAAHEARGAAIRHFAKDRYEAILPTWKTQSRQPQTPTELVAVARGLIEARSKECLPLIEQLREYEPLEADSLMALHLLRQHDIQPAVEIAGRTLEKLRSRAWPQRTALTPLLDAVFELGQVHPKSTLWAVQVLSQDYDMDWAVNRRHAQVLTLAESLPDDLYAKCLSLDEPYPRWNGRLLQQRAEVYAHLRHPLAAQAQRDWQAYQQMAPRSRLLAE
jgi:spermidine synthase